MLFPSTMYPKIAKKNRIIYVENEVGALKYREKKNRSTVTTYY
jgi:hypothetical protein